MSKILELYDKRNRAVNAARAFLDSRAAVSDTLCAEDAAAYERMEDEIIALNRQIERENKLSAIENDMKQPLGQPITNAPHKPETEKTGRASGDYKRAFWNAMRGRIDVEIKNALSVGTDSEGGFLVPTEYERQLITGLEQENILRQYATVIQTAGDRKIPVIAAKGTATWLDEGAAITESDSSFSQITIGAWKLGTAIKVSNELINDSAFDIEQYIVNEFARRVGAKEEEAFFVGDGSNQPTGLLAATGGAELGVTTNSATALTFDEIFDLFYSLKSSYRDKAVFIVHDSTAKALRKLKDSSGQYLWEKAVSEGAPDTLCGRPVVTSAYMPQIGAGNKTVLFGDLSYYWIADRQGR
ncbi:MAG: phage major capsid protein, partial [Firmicutes bacterium]|nr:phage major capsid protein [Bacillota bacterium]